MGLIGGRLMVLGGDNGRGLTSIEELRNLTWVETNNLRVGRTQHAMVELPTNFASCQAP